MASMPIGTLNPSLPLADAGGKPDNARIHEVARKLEGQFAQMMIKCMREAGFGDSLFPGENQIFRDMYDQQIATAMSQGRGLGLAPMIARQLGATDAATPAVPATTALSAYKRLLPGTDADSMLDAIAGRLNLFVRSDEQEQAWRWVEPILETWKNSPQGPRPYAAGTWGPSASSAMIARDGYCWSEES